MQGMYLRLVGENLDRRKFIKNSCTTLILGSSGAFGRESERNTDYVKDNLTKIEKIRRFDEDLPGDIFVELSDVKSFYSLAKKLNRLRSYVGYGNFNLVSFDEFLALSRKVLDWNPSIKKNCCYLRSCFLLTQRNTASMAKK